VAFIGDLVVRISATTKQLNAPIAKSQQALTQLTTVATKTVQAVSDLNNIAFDSTLEDSLTTTVTAMDDLHDATSEITTTLRQMESATDYAVSSTQLLSTGLTVASSASQSFAASSMAANKILATSATVTASASGAMAAGTAVASRGLTSLLISVVAARQATTTLSYAFGLAADGARVLLIPLRAMASILATVGSIGLKVASMLLTPFKLVFASLKLVASAAMQVLGPFLGLAGGALKLYVTFRAFKLQLQILSKLFGFLPTKVKVLFVGLMGLGAASRMATAALNSMGIVGRAAAKAISLLTLPIRAIISPMQTARAVAGGLNATLAKTAAISTKAGAALTGGVTKGIKSIGTGTGGAFKNVAAFATGALPFAAVGAMKLAADAETLAIKMKVLTGSTDEASRVMGQLDQFAADTPFQKMEIGDAVQQLLAFGSSSATVFDEMKMLGDISAATGTPIGEMAELYGKAQVQGRLFAEDINQLTGRGIPIIGELAKQFGVSESEVKKLVEAGKIGFPEMQKGLAAMAGHGGKFGGMMAELSTTTAGRFSTFVDNVYLLGTQIGSQLLPVANELLVWGTNFVASADGIGTAFSTALATIGTWYTDTKNFMMDIGTVFGVLVGNMGNIWAGLFEDIPKFATATFSWLTENAGVLIANIGAMVENMFTKLNTTGKQLGEWLAYKTGLSDEMIDIAEVQKKPMQATTAFQAPELSSATKTVIDDVNKALEENAANRATAAVNAAAAQQTNVAQATAAALNTSFVKQTASDKQGASGSSVQSAGVAEKGSLDAWKILLANRNQRDPVVKATEKQTKEIVKTLKETKPIVPQFAPEFA
jgi:tape measure domain-containing protein